MYGRDEKYIEIFREELEWVRKFGIPGFRLG
jgi:hypothetical protein